MSLAPAHVPIPATPSDGTDLLLIGRIVARDQVALAEFYVRAASFLKRRAAHILSEQAEAEDIVHDVFVHIWQNASQFDASRGDPFAWAAAITHNRAVDRVRTRIRRAAVLELAFPLSLAEAEETCAPEAALCLDADDFQVIRCAIGALPEPMRVAVRLIYFERLNYRQAAAQLGLPIGTVKARVHRSLYRLKALLRRAGFAHATLVATALNRPEIQSSGRADRSLEQAFSAATEPALAAALRDFGDSP